MLGSETKTKEILKGLEQSLLRNINYKFLLFGNQESILKNLKKFKKLQSACEIIDKPFIFSKGLPGSLVADILEGIITKVFIIFSNYYTR